MDSIIFSNLVFSIKRSNSQFIYIIISPISETVIVNAPNELEPRLIYTYIQSNINWILEERGKLYLCSNNEKPSISFLFTSVKKLINQIEREALLLKSV